MTLELRLMIADSHDHNMIRDLKMQIRTLGEDLYFYLSVGFSLVLTHFLFHRDAKSISYEQVVAELQTQRNEAISLNGRVQYNTNTPFGCSVLCFHLLSRCVSSKLWPRKH